MPVILHLPTGTALIHPTWVETRLPCGAVVNAVPQHTDEQRRMAAEFGYGADLDAMTRDHDPLHLALAGWLGLPCSYSLRDAAGRLPEDQRPLAWAEEAAVLAVQKFGRLAGADLLAAMRGR